MVRLTFSFGFSWCALGAFGPPRAGADLFVVVVGFSSSFFFLVSFPLLPLVVPPLCPALRVFRPRVPSALASCPPPLSFSLPPFAAPCCLLLCAVVLCRLFASLPVAVISFLPLRVCCVCSRVSCCVFPVLPVRCAVRVVCAISGGWCCWFLVSLPFVGGLLVALVAQRCPLVVCVGCGARVWSGSRWLSSLWCPAPTCCVLWRCAAVWCCAVVPCLLVLFFPLLVALVSCCSPLVLGSGPVPGHFCFCALPVRCCAGVPASLLSVRCSLALAGLAGVLCCCLLCLCVCCLAWLSSVVFWWVLVAPGVVSRWRAVVCPLVLCYAVLLRVVPPGVALLCAVLFRFALFGAAARCVVSWGAVRRRGVLCLLAPCFVLSPRAVCVLLWCVAAWCCSPLCFVPCAPWGVVLCVSCRLRPVRCCCVARSPSVPCSPVLCPVVLCCRVVPWCPVLPPCWVCFLRGCGCTYLRKPLQNFVKYFPPFFLAFENKRKNNTRPNTLACSKTMYAAVPYVLPVVLDVLGLVLVRGVVERVDVHC